MKEIIINEMNDAKDILVVQNGILVERYIDKDEKERSEGDIYLGSVQNILPGMNACFVDIGKEKNTFMHLKDILPKIDITNNKDVIANNSNIKDVVKTKDKILVQIKRDKTNNKGARVSTHITLPGRYVVFMPNIKFNTISQKIESKEERERLLNIVKDILPDNAGIIVRTSAKGKNEKEIKKDLEKLIEKWRKINSFNKEAPVLIEKSSSLIEKLLIDLVDQGVKKISVNNKTLHDEINKILIELEETAIENIYVEDILDVYDLKEQLEKLDNRKVWLPCGGFITIDRTEALTAIDINSGKYTGSKNLEDTVFTVNKEATIEIARQLRLRDIGGIVIIDYIDMIENTNKDKIVSIFENELKNDRSKTQILGFTKLDLLEMTRKHMVAE